MGLKNMSIEKMVEQALQDGYLTPDMKAEITRICNKSTDLSVEEYMALDRLMAELPGCVDSTTLIPHKQFSNVMEELVLKEAIAQWAIVAETTDTVLDVGDIAAYALNRLPGLYATTSDGAGFHRSLAKGELDQLIVQKVQEAIARCLEQPEIYPKRKPLKIKLTEN